MTTYAFFIKLIESEIRGKIGYNPYAASSEPCHKGIFKRNYEGASGVQN